MTIFLKIISQKPPNSHLNQQILVCCKRNYIFVITIRMLVLKTNTIEYTKTNKHAHQIIK